MAGGRALGVVATLGAGQLGDLSSQKLGHDLEADRGRGRQQLFAPVLGERREVAVDTAGELLRKPRLEGRDERERSRADGPVELGRRRVRTLPWGSSSRL